MVVTAYVAKISDRRSEVNCPLTFEARPYLQVSRTWGQSGDNIVGGYGSANSLEFKLANWLDLTASLTAIRTRGLIRI